MGWTFSLHVFYASVIIHGVLFVVSGYFDGAFVILKKNYNCTQKPNLPCEVHTSEWPCPPEENVPKTWPGCAENVVVSYALVPHNKRCLAHLNVSWIIPNDYSAISLTGFQLELLAMSGEIRNIQICATFDLSVANFTKQDITDQVAYHYDDVLMVPGQYTLFLYSLPRPQMYQNDKYVQRQIKIPRGFYDKGKCVLPHTTTVGKTRPPSTEGSTTQHAPSGIVAQPVPEEEFWTFQMKLAIGIGSGVGVSLVVVLVLVIRRPWAKNPRNLPSLPPGAADSAEDLLIDHGDSISGNGDNYDAGWPYLDTGSNEVGGPSSIPPTVYCPREPVLGQPLPVHNVSPMDPDDVGSDFSRAASSLNRYKRPC